jgi:hypothetical protein
MKKFITYLFTVFVLVTCLNFFGSFLLDLLISKSNFRWINMFNESPSAYVIGNSRGVNSIVEKEFNENCELEILNLSYNGLQPPEIKHLVKFTDIEKPLIIEISTFLLQTNFDLDEFRFSSIKNLRNYSDFSTTFFPLFNYNNDLTLRLLYYNFTNDKSWVNSGVLGDIEAKIYESKLSNLSYDLSKLIDFIQFLDNRGQDYILYHAPIHNSYKKSITNFDKVVDQIKELSPSFLDLSSSLQSNEFFADLGHSNNIGAIFLQDTLCEHFEYYLKN